MDILEKSEIAVKAFQGDNNCAQSVLLAFANDFNVQEALCLRIASGFGGGIAMSGAMCGALTGGIMALGLKGTGEGVSKDKTYEDSKALIHMFETRFGTTDCKLLTELKTDKDTKAYCDKFVREAASMVDLLLNKK